MKSGRMFSAAGSTHTVILFACFYQIIPNIRCYFFSHLLWGFATLACERPRTFDVFFAPFVLTRCNRPLSNLGRFFGDYATHFPGCSPHISWPRLGSATPGLAGLWPSGSLGCLCCLYPFPLSLSAHRQRPGTQQDGFLSLCASLWCRSPNPWWNLIGFRSGSLTGLPVPRLCLSALSKIVANRGVRLQAPDLEWTASTSLLLPLDKTQNKAKHPPPPTKPTKTTKTYFPMKQVIDIFVFS